MQNNNNISGSSPSILSELDLKMEFLLFLCKSKSMWRNWVWCGFLSEFGILTSSVNLFDRLSSVKVIIFVTFAFSFSTKCRSFSEARWPNLKINQWKKIKSNQCSKVTVNSSPTLCLFRMTDSWRYLPFCCQCNIKYNY